ncbi:MAG TPA: RsmE family RNA methyltransferase [Acidimicrobiales bacterium]|jgi:16S rRNA (uracil1498-N3)-methyltransferase|nr:RsmE family RNA methyltransferase [Acidimicrobiales bacterium]
MAPLRGRGPLAFVDDLERPQLSDDDRHHFVRVRRVRGGDDLVISDGQGRWRTARWGDRIEPVGEVHEDPEPAPLVTVGFALVKGERPEWIVQKLTEVGVDRIVPLRAARSVVRWDRRKAEANRDRLRRVARGAAMQAHRTRVPVVDDLVDLDVALGAPGVGLADFGGDAPTLATPTVLIGPEGGWSDEERAGRATVSLGPTVLRAETAAVAAGVALCGLRAHLFSPNPH